MLVNICSCTQAEYLGSNDFGHNFFMVFGDSSQIGGVLYFCLLSLLYKEAGYGATIRPFSMGPENLCGNTSSKIIQLLSYKFCRM
jgi:hypothetical protein